MTSYTYLMPHRTLPCFKIGKSDDPLLRASRIGRGVFNIRRAKVVSMRDAKDARALEKSLHLLFRQFSYSSSELPNSGASEWFDIKCLDGVLRFIENNFVGSGVACVDSFPSYSKARKQTMLAARLSDNAFPLKGRDLKRFSFQEDIAAYVSDIRRQMPAYRGWKCRGNFFISTREPLPFLNEGVLSFVANGMSHIVLRGQFFINLDIQKSFVDLPGIHYLVGQGGEKWKEIDQLILAGLSLQSLVDADDRHHIELAPMEW